MKFIFFLLPFLICHMFFKEVSGDDSEDFTSAEACESYGKYQEPCEETSVWYYSTGTERCEKKTGCLKAPNSFKTNKECVQKCENTRSPCLAPLMDGWCRARITRWYFNDESKECEEFQYMGCGGSRNKFKTESDCKITCQSYIT